jgi:ribosomal protein S8
MVNFNKKSKNTVQLLYYFYKIGLIKNYLFINNSMLLIFNFVFNIFVINKIKILSNSIKKIYIKKKLMKSLFYLKYDNSILILTNKNLLTLKESFSKKIGGILLAKIF